MPVYCLAPNCLNWLYESAISADGVFGFRLAVFRTAFFRVKVFTGMISYFILNGLVIARDLIEKTMPPVKCPMYPLVSILLLIFYLAIHTEKGPSFCFTTIFFDNGQVTAQADLFSMGEPVLFQFKFSFPFQEIKTV